MLDDIGWRIAVVDLVQALLTEGVTHEHVGIVGRLQEAFGVDGARAQIDQVQELGCQFGVVAQVVVVGVDGQGIKEIAVDGDFPEIPRAGRAEQWQHQIRPVGNAPVGQGDAEIVLLEWQADTAGRIKEAAEADGQVDQEAPAGLQRALGPALQEVIAHRDRHAKIGEEVADRAAHRVIGDLAVADRDRPDHRLVQGPVEGIGLAIEFFPWIVVSRLRHGAAGQQQDQAEGYQVFPVCERLLRCRAMHRFRFQFCAIAGVPFYCTMQFAKYQNPTGRANAVKWQAAHDTRPGPGTIVRAIASRPVARINYARGCVRGRFFVFQGFELMARITVEDCLEVVDNRFELVMMATRRARQLANGAEPTVDPEADKPSVVALREIAERRIDMAMIDEIDRAERERKEREALEWAAAEVDEDLSKSGDDL